MLVRHGGVCFCWPAPSYFLFFSLLCAVKKRTSQNLWPLTHPVFNPILKTVWSVVYLFKFAGPAAKFWESDPLLFAFFSQFFLVAEIPQRGGLVHENSLTFCQLCCHNVESRALSCPFKQSNLSAWSPLSWHSTHTHLWGVSLSCQRCFLSTVTVTQIDLDYVNKSASLKQVRSKSTLFNGIKCVKEVVDHYGLETRLKCDFDFSRKKWTFSSGLLLCKGFRRRREDTAWKWKSIHHRMMKKSFWKKKIFCGKMRHRPDFVTVTHCSICFHCNALQYSVRHCYTVQRTRRVVACAYTQAL